MKSNGIFILLALLFAACQQARQQSVVTPWGEEMTIDDGSAPITKNDDSAFDLDAIEHSGELIALTISGPETYYDYHGQTMGLHALLCQQLADSLGVKLRIELCRDTAELMQRLNQGDGDLAAYPLAKPDSLSPGWLVAPEKPLLAEALHRWYSPAKQDAARSMEQGLLTTARVKRQVFAPMLNQKGGIISRYDAYFQVYGKTIRWDWRLLAAQCYQESTFDPNALSWAGARGLMQIMPATAQHLGVKVSQLSDPEQNIAAATRYLEELERTFSDIANRRQRQDFILAAYNGGAHHIRDAMALARRDGHNPHIWGEVAPYVLRLSEPRYYQDPLVKNGYMRGSETVDYVRLIRQRYQQYRGVKSPASGASSPQKSRNERHRKKFSV